MKKIISLLCIFVVLCFIQSGFAGDAKKSKPVQAKKQKNIECVQQLHKPLYYQPYNIPGGPKKYAKDYNSGWDIKVDAIKKKDKQGKKN